MVRKPDLLFITPVVPQPFGAGRTLRAWAWLKVLSVDYEVHVLVAGDAETQAPGAPHWASLHFLPAGFPQKTRWRRRLALMLPVLALRHGFATEFFQVADPSSTALDGLAGINPVRIVVFRIYLHDVASFVRARFPDVRTDIDLDDLESHARLSIAHCHARLGRWAAALREVALSAQYKLVEFNALSSYEKIYLAAGRDAGRVRRRLQSSVDGFPNRLAAQHGHTAAQPSRVLFIGSLGYAPNEEAALLALEIARQLRDHPKVKVTIAGRGANTRLHDHLATNPLVDFIENPPHLAPLYAAALAIIVPLKAGGGTKFKTIEAFAYGRPVVSTAEGVRGLGARAGEHYLPAETSADFAAAVMRLATEPQLANHIATAGHQLWQSEFSL